MSSRSLKRTIKRSAWLLALSLITCISCKKEVIQVNVDAFAKLDAKLELDEDVYQLQFSLQDYPYKEAGVRLSSSKSMFQQTQGINTQTAVQISANRYAVYYDTFVEGTTYYYQIYVIDPLSARTVYSDIYSFTTSK